MKISTKGRYGLRIMLELALGHGGKAVTMQDIAKRQDLSRKYVHSLLIIMKAAGLVRSVRGAEGGYSLTRSPAKILVSEIVKTLEGEFTPVNCLKNRSVCKRSAHCAGLEVWKKLGQAMEDALAKFNLAQLARRQRQIQKS